MTSPAAPIATARIRIRPDYGTFKADVKAESKEAVDAASGQVKIGADTAEAKVKVDALKARIDEMRRTTATAKVELQGDVKALAQLDRIDLSLRRVGATTARPKVTLEGAERAQIQLDALQARMVLIGRTTAGSGGAGSGGLFNRLANYGKSGGFFSPNGLGLLGASAVPLAGPLVGAAAGGAAAFLTPSVAGTVGLGAFGAGAKASITQANKEAEQLAKIRAKLATTSATVTTTSKPASAAQIEAAQLRLNAAEIRAAQAKSPAAQASAQASVLSAQSSLTSLQGRGGTTTKDNKEYQKLLKQEHDLLKGLDPAQRKAVVNIQQLDKAWVSYQKHLQPQTFAFLADGAKIGEKGLGLLLPIAQGVGNELDHLEKRADAALSQPFWHDFFTKFLATEAPHAIDTLGVTAGHFFDGLAHLTEKFAPLGHDLESWMVRISGRFDTWTQGAGPGKFVVWVEQNGPMVASTIKALATGVEGIATGLAPIGKIELQALTPVLEFIGDLGKQHPEVITALGAAYLSVAFGLKGIAAVKGLSGVVGVVKGIAGGKAGGAGGGGILGGVTERGASPANPLYVFVVDQVGGGGGPKGGGVGSTIANDAKNVAEGGTLASILARGKRLAGRLGELGPGVIGTVVAAGGIYNMESHAGPGPLNKAAAFAAGSYGFGAQHGELGPKVPVVRYGSVPIVGDAHNNSSAGGRIVGVEYLPQSIDSKIAELKKARDQLQQMLQGAGAGNQDHIDRLAKVNAEIKQLEQQALAGGRIVGQNISIGMAQGIDSGFKQHVLRAVTTMADGTIKVVSTKFELGSPSKLFMRYGGWAAEGLGIGYAQQMPQVIATFKKSTAAGLAAIGGMVGAAQAQLAADMASRGSAASGIASGLSGGYGLGNAFGPYGNVLNLSSFLGGGRSTLRKIDIDLRTLDRKHLSPGLLAQIAQLPPQQALAVATNILSGESGSIPTLNRLQSDVDRYAGFAGSIGAEAQSRQTILADERSLQILQQIATALKNNPKDVAAAFDAALRGAQVHHR